jgi:oligoendopeptidase F
MDTSTIPPRSAVPVEYTWDLSKLYPSDSAWNDGLAVYEKMIEKIESYRGTLGRSADTLADWLDFYKEMGMLEERLAYYCELRQTEDEGASEARTMTGRFAMAQARSQAAASWAVPEIQAIPDSSIQSFLQHERLAEYRIYLQKLLRWKPYILSDKEERLLALHAEGESVPRDAFSVLTNVDIDFGTIDTPEGKRPLS